jgi:uncharacterized membrane protein YesL
MPDMTNIVLTLLVVFLLLLLISYVFIIRSHYVCSLKALFAAAFRTSTGFAGGFDGN